MKIKTSHIAFTNKQRYGIFLLLFLIVVLQSIYVVIVWPTAPKLINDDALHTYNVEVDSLKQQALKDNKPKLFPFNPNYITDFKGYTLGMSNEEIDKLLAYRRENKWVNSAEDFQKVTGVSDSLLDELSPYFKFPDWVLQTENQSGYKQASTKRNLSFTEKGDLNTASALQLQQVYGVGEKLSERIVKFRASFDGGFIDDIQLQDVYGLTPETIKQITQRFTVKSPRVVKKINLNTATLNELVTIQHIDYPLAHNIIEERTLREGFSNLDELLKVKNFPVQKIDIIKLYLALD